MFVISSDCRHGETTGNVGDEQRCLVVEIFCSDLPWGLLINDVCNVSHGCSEGVCVLGKELFWIEQFKCLG